MIRFLLSFIAVYSLMHALFYLRVRVLLPDRWPWHLLMTIFLVLMMLAPIGARLLERSGHHDFARISAYLGYSWMGFLFYAFLLSLMLVITGLVFKLINIATAASLPVFTGRGGAFCIIFVSMAIITYGYFEGRSLKVERLTVATSKLPQGIDRIRVVQISDIHLGLLVGDGTLSGIIDKVKAEEPDIVVSTGDLVDGDMDRIGNLPEIFSALEPKLGKYAVTGNHEVYVGLAAALKAEQEFGFSVLRGEARVVGRAINIIGVDDPATGIAIDESALLAKEQNGLFTLLLKHRPEVLPESLGLFDLQLSGHTHYGQLFPFRVFSRLVYPYQNGPYLLEKGSVLYTSRGSATWGPPFRVLAPPEITVIDIVRR